MAAALALLLLPAWSAGKSSLLAAGRAHEKGHFDALPGGILLDRTYPVEARVLRETIYADGCKFASAFFRYVSRSNATKGKWRQLDGCWQRELSYTAARSVLVASHRVVERQTMLHLKQHGCVVDTVALTPDVPYGSTFVTRTRCIIMPAAGAAAGAAARLQVSFEIEWVASAPLIKAAIVSGARKGMLRNFNCFVEVLEKLLRVRPIVPEQASQPSTRTRHGVQTVLTRTTVVGLVVSVASWLTLQLMEAATTAATA
ncbi:hypothetical protein AB1Y20_014761 [Prymnesium parvum]|uniref:VASt domain-containing protein n=1 Tax=Prymnesium parvum TaxID=97485 RepID=A0AB34IBL9_PRYPA